MTGIEIIDVENDGIVVEETVPSGTTVPTRHGALSGRFENDQHSINAICGLEAELKRINSPHVVESDKVGVAEYYRWKDGNPNKEARIGYFVFISRSDTREISIYSDPDTQDVFGVTTDTAGFIGGQTTDIPRGDDWAMVVTNGLAKVRCESDVVVGDIVVPNESGIAEKSQDCKYGNRVVFIDEADPLIRYAHIYMGISPKQAGDIALEMRSVDSRLTKANSDITTLQTNVQTLTEATSSNAAITGGTIGGWNIVYGDNSVKGFEVEFDDGYKASVYSDTANGSPYVFGVSQETMGEDDNQTSWKFGVKPNGDTTISKADIGEITTNDGSIGGWKVNEDGLSVEYNKSAVPGRYVISGRWTLNSVVALPEGESDPILEQEVVFDCGGVDYEGIRIGYDTGAPHLYFINDGENEEPGKSDIDFGVSEQTISAEFYNWFKDNAISKGGKMYYNEGSEAVSYTTVLNSNLNSENSNILEIQKDGETVAYFGLDGDMVTRINGGTVGGWDVTETGLSRKIYALSDEPPVSFVNFYSEFQEADPVISVGTNNVSNFSVDGHGYLRSTGAYLSQPTITEPTISGGTITNIDKITSEEAYIDVGGYIHACGSDSNGCALGIDGDAFIIGDLRLGYNDESSIHLQVNGSSTIKKNLNVIGADNNGNGLYVVESALVDKNIQIGHNLTVGNIVTVEGGINVNGLTQQDYGLWAEGSIRTDKSYCLGGHHILQWSNGIELGYSTGEHYLQGTWIADNLSITTSDINKKNSINSMDDKYEILFDSLMPRTYKYNDGTSGRLHIGFVAQEVQEAARVAEIPESDFAAVCTVYQGTEKEFTGLRYGEFVSLNTWQIQKLKARVKELEDKIATLSN